MIELLEGKIEKSDLQHRMRQIIAREQSRTRRHRPLKTAPGSHGAMDDEASRGPGAGQIGGFPYNSMKETTWS